SERPVIKEGEPQPRFSAPAVAKIHRLVAAHVQKRMDESSHSQAVKNVAEVFDKKQKDLEAKWQHDPSIIWVMRSFGDNAIHLARGYPQELTFAIGCGVLGQAEMTTGSIANAQRLTDQCVRSLRFSYEKNKADQEASRLFSAALSDQGSFYLARGKSGDAELALGHFQESLDIARQIAEANPNSAQALRDLLVSLGRLSDILGSTESDDAKKNSLALQTQALEIALNLHQSNPGNLYLGRTAAITAIRAYEKSRLIGQDNLGGQCLGACYTVLKTLVDNGCQLDEQMEQTYQQLKQAFTQGQ
ncbi:MAG: hypothetical protein ACKOAH_12020, partial [Pirellula sp.]